MIDDLIFRKEHLFIPMTKDEEIAYLKDKIKRLTADPEETVSLLSDTEDQVEELQAQVEALKKRQIILPVITDEMAEDFEGDGLIEVLENGSYNWTQTAVDFACVLKIANVPASEQGKLIGPPSGAHGYGTGGRR